jgi:hypothetical protein
MANDSSPRAEIIRRSLDLANAEFSNAMLGIAAFAFLSTSPPTYRIPTRREPPVDPYSGKRR